MYLLVVFLDAFRYDYVTEANSPFMFHLAKEGHKAKIKPPLGYSSGITASLWTGTYPQTHGDWFYWGHVRGHPGWNPPIFNLFKIFPKGKIRLIAKHGLLYLLLRQELGSPARAWFMPAIPDESLPYLTKLGNDFNPHNYICQVPTFFDFLDRENIPYRWTDLSSWGASTISPMLTEKDKRNVKSNFFVDVFSSSNFDNSAMCMVPVLRGFHWKSRNWTIS